MGFAPIGRSVKSSARPPGERRFEPAVGEGHRDVQSRVITCWLLFFFVFVSVLVELSSPHTFYLVGRASFRGAYNLAPIVRGEYFFRFIRSGFCRRLTWRCDWVFGGDDVHNSNDVRKRLCGFLCGIHCHCDIFGCTNRV